MTSHAPAAPAAPEVTGARRRVLDPTEHFSEVLFGLIMVVTCTGSISAASSGREEIRTILLGALGCNLAWGIIDAVLYVLGAVGERGSSLVALRRVREATEPSQAHALIAEAAPLLASVLSPEELESVRRRLVALPEPPSHARATRDDLRGAVGIFLLVFLSTFPVAIPFLVMQDAVRALRVSHGIAIGLLFFAGWSMAKHTGHPPWRTGLIMVGIGAVLVVITMAFGG